MTMSYITGPVCAATIGHAIAIAQSFGMPFSGFNEYLMSGITPAHGPTRPPAIEGNHRV